VSLLIRVTSSGHPFGIFILFLENVTVICTWRKTCNIYLWEIDNWECELKFSNPTHYILILVGSGVGDFFLGGVSVVLFCFFAYVLLVFVLRFACPMLPKILVYQFVVPPSMFSIVYMLCVNLFFPLTKTYPSATFWIKNCGLNQRRLCIAWYRVRIRPGFIR
jgi:hypothetical protein